MKSSFHPYGRISLISHHHQFGLIGATLDPVPFCPCTDPLHSLFSFPAESGSVVRIHGPDPPDPLRLGIRHLPWLGGPDAILSPDHRHRFVPPHPRPTAPSLLRSSSLCWIRSAAAFGILHRLALTHDHHHGLSLHRTPHTPLDPPSSASSLRQIRTPTAVPMRSLPIHGHCHRFSFHLTPRRSAQSAKPSLLAPPDPPCRSGPHSRPLPPTRSNAPPSFRCIRETSLLALPDPHSRSGPDAIPSHSHSRPPRSAGSTASASSLHRVRLQFDHSQARICLPAFLTRPAACAPHSRPRCASIRCTAPPDPPSTRSLAPPYPCLLTPPDLPWIRLPTASHPLHTRRTGPASHWLPALTHSTAYSPHRSAGSAIHALPRSVRSYPPTLHGYVPSPILPGSHRNNTPLPSLTLPPTRPHEALVCDCVAALSPRCRCYVTPRKRPHTLPAQLLPPFVCSTLHCRSHPLPLTLAYDNAATTAAVLPDAAASVPPCPSLLTSEAGTSYYVNNVARSTASVARCSSRPPITASMYTSYVGEILCISTLGVFVLVWS
ncbi:hypothetical protein MVEN_00130900 [Mycena venus]|uniref:Uncharacterized protein n=1 Tax=Mycena venus TaxID=2733690 RepID=A0A8H6Z9A1_9AGAR|nr:hypothetical protein MVEN_00130900 [Mycena venus]